MVLQKDIYSALVQCFLLSAASPATASTSSSSAVAIILLLETRSAPLLNKHTQPPLQKRGRRRGRGVLDVSVD